MCTTSIYIHTLHNIHIPYRCVRCPIGSMTALYRKASHNPEPLLYSRILLMPLIIRVDRRVILRAYCLTIRQAMPRSKLKKGVSIEYICVYGCIYVCMCNYSYCVYIGLLYMNVYACI